MIDVTSKLGEINNIEHNKGKQNISSKSSYYRLYYASIPLKHKCFSNIQIWSFLFLTSRSGL